MNDFWFPSALDISTVGSVIVDCIIDNETKIKTKFFIDRPLNYTSILELVRGGGRYVKIFS
jgi:hypothetical protein